MKRLNAENDNNPGAEVTHTQNIWEARLGRQITAEGARQIQHNISGFFGVLIEWARSERAEPANDASSPSEPNDGEGRHDR